MKTLIALFLLYSVSFADHTKKLSVNDIGVNVILIGDSGIKLGDENEGRQVIYTGIVITKDQQDAASDR